MYIFACVLALGAVSVQLLSTLSAAAVAFRTVRNRGFVERVERASRNASFVVEQLWFCGAARSTGGSSLVQARGAVRVAELTNCYWVREVGARTTRKTGQIWLKNFPRETAQALTARWTRAPRTVWIAGLACDSARREERTSFAAQPAASVELLEVVRRTGRASGVQCRGAFQTCHEAGNAVQTGHFVEIARGAVCDAGGVVQFERLRTDARIAIRTARTRAVATI